MMRLLLVDDEPAALERLGALLTQVPDIEVVGTARNGRETAEAQSERNRQKHEDVVHFAIPMLRINRALSA